MENSKIGFLDYLKISTLSLLVSFTLGLTGCSSPKEEEAAADEEAAALSPCSIGSVTTGPCKVSDSGVAVSNSFGADVETWDNQSSSTTVKGSIPNGFYANHEVEFTEPNLVAANIVAGVSIFGVTGTAAGGGGPAACSDDALNANACATASNRYVTSVNGSNLTLWTNVSASTTVAGSLATGFYSGRSCQFTDANLISSNIRSGTSVFGVTGN